MSGLLPAHRMALTVLRRQVDEGRKEDIGINTTAVVIDAVDVLEVEVAELTTQRDQAREVAVALEQEVAVMTIERDGEIERLRTARQDAYDEVVRLKREVADSMQERLERLSGAQRQQDLSRGEHVSLLHDRNNAGAVLMKLFPSLAWDGTALHAAIIARDEIEQLREAVTEEIANRDVLNDRLDELANAIGGEEIGEHSTSNDPWANALEIAGLLRADHARLQADVATLQQEVEQLRSSWGFIRDGA